MNKKIILVISSLLTLTSCGLYNEGANQIIKTSDELLEDELKANGSLCGLAIKAFDENSNIVQTYQFQELNEEDSNPIENLPNFISFLAVSDSYDPASSPFYQHVVTYTIPYCDNKSTAVQVAGIFYHKATKETSLTDLDYKIMSTSFFTCSVQVKGLYGFYNSHDYCCTYKTAILNVTGYESTRIEVKDATNKIVSNVSYTDVSKVPSSFDFTTGESVNIYDTYNGIERLTDTLTKSGSIFFGFTDEYGFSNHHRVSAIFK